MDLFQDIKSLGHEQLVVCHDPSCDYLGIIAIHDVPYEIAKHRNHPHQDAIHAAGWVSLFTLHALWPFLWIWAMLYRPDRGWGIATTDDAARGGPDRLDELLRRIESLEAQAKLEKRASPRRQPVAAEAIDELPSGPRRGAG